MSETTIPGMTERGTLCKTCAEACLKHWPSMTLSDVNDMLWGATAYPMGDCAHNVAMIDEMAEVIGDDWRAACGYADRKMTEDLERCRTKARRTT